jgi:hypothetical protein
MQKPSKPQRRWDNVYLGALMGLLFPVIGFLIYYLYYFYGHMSLYNYWNQLFYSHTISAMISLSLIANFPVFLFYFQGKKYKAARGVLGVTIFYGAFVFIFYFIR